MPLFESQAVATVHRYSHAALYFPGDLVGPDPSSAVLPSVLYFPGLMRARRLRLHRHRMSSMSYWSLRSSWTSWSSPLPLNYYFQAGGAPSRPWKLFNVVPRKDDGNDNRSKDNKRLYPVHNFMLPRAAAADVPSLFYFFQVIWIHPGTPLCSSQVVSSGQQLPRLRCVLYYIFRAKGPFRLDSKTVNSGVNRVIRLNRLIRLT
jgi:hypothetical protein